VVAVASGARCTTATNISIDVVVRGSGSGSDELLATHRWRSGQQVAQCATATMRPVCQGAAPQHLKWQGALGCIGLGWAGKKDTALAVPERSPISVLNKPDEV
jgi:hypothetical protein